MYKNNKKFNNKLSNIARIRVLADRNLIKRDKKDYDECDIFFNINNKKLDNKFMILMIGSRDIDNPYYGGFFMFKGCFPDQYPFFPPIIKSKTQGENTRFHPNFYINGKCCISILGTWAGPPWTSCQNLGTVAKTIKSLYIRNPITQEPSWEKCIDHRAENYFDIIRYRTLQVACLNMMINPPLGFDEFIPLMEKHFLELYKGYMEIIEIMKPLHGKIIKSPIYGMNVIIDTITLKKDFENKYKYLLNKYNLIETHTKDTNIDNTNIDNTNIDNTNIDNTNIDNTNIDNSMVVNTSVNNTTNVNTTVINNIDESKTIEKPIKTKIINKSKKYKRMSPNEPAKIYNLGFKKKSENGKKDIWIVYETKSGQKRWKKF